MAKTGSHSAQGKRYDKLAAQYLDLMQRQMTGSITHPDFIRAMLELTTAMGTPDAAARHTAAASQSGNDAIPGLKRRVAKLERDLAALSTQLADAGLGGRSGARGAKRGAGAKPDKARAGAKKAAKGKPKRRT